MNWTGRHGGPGFADHTFADCSPAACGERHGALAAEYARPAAVTADPFGPRAAHSAEAMEAEMCDLPEPGDFPCCVDGRRGRDADREAGG